MTKASISTECQPLDRSLLLRDTEGLRFFAVVADKLSVLEYVRQRNKREPAYRYHPNELYDSLTGYLFKERLSQHNRYRIIFSKRGKPDRLNALRKLVEAASESLTQQNTSDAPLTDVFAATPKEHAGLQAVDYLFGRYSDSMSEVRSDIWYIFGTLFDLYTILMTCGKIVMERITHKRNLWQRQS